MPPTRPLVLLATTALAAGLVAAPALGAGSGSSKACPTGAPLTFGAPSYVDRTRAGGEPLVATHPSGRLIYTSHAGTTHFFTPQAANPGSAAFAQNYQGQTYIWTSDDDGRTWQFRSRVGPGDAENGPSGAPNSGFSDPELAFDSAGNVYFSEINLANVAVSKSSDRGSTWHLQNLFGAILTDRQWMEADRRGELYFVANAFGGGTGVPPNTGTGHYIAKSTDGGKTFTTGKPDRQGGAGLGDIRVDKRTGTVYEAHLGGGVLSMAAFRKARRGDLTATDTNTIATGVDMAGHWPAFDLDPKGNLYVTWDERGRGSRPAGIWYSRSTDAGRTWAKPVQVSDGKRTAIWPWLGVGDEGRVGIMWLEASTKLPGHNAETQGSHGWRIHGAVTTNGLGCTTSSTPGFSTAVATKQPVHTGTICQGGTTCQAFLIDRRLGDYFSVDVDGKGRLYAGYSDTQVAASVSLPGFVRQTGGPSLLAKPAR